MHIFLHVHHNTVQCEGTGATERLAIFPKLFYVLHKKYFVSVRLSMCDRLPGYIYIYIFFKGVSALTYTNISSTLWYQYTVRNSGC